MRAVARAFAQNPVFANIVVVLILFAGYMAASRMQRATFPDFSLGEIQITVLYPGADPFEVEEGVSRKIEEALEGLGGIREVVTVSNENMATARLKIDPHYDTRQVLDHVRSRVDAISTFPVDTENPIITDLLYLDLVLAVTLVSDMPERRLKRWAEETKDELLELPTVSQVLIAGSREFEIAVEVSEERLQSYGMTMADVTRAIQASSLNLPAGSIRTEREEVRLRTLGRKYTGHELQQIVLSALPSGEVVTLDHVAEIRDGFSEDPFAATLDGTPTVALLVSKTKEEDAIQIADAVRSFVARKQGVLPPGSQMVLMYDLSEYLRGRINLLFRNGVAGLCLVVLLIWIFLDFRLSFWVGMGMPISIAGGLVVMWAMGETLNMISLFSLIMVIGLIVDDGIVVGEAIHRKRGEGFSALDAAIEGLGEVGWPVLAGVTTTLVAFLPLAFVSGVMGKFVRVLPIVVIACLIVSLVEVLLLFPAHLRHLPDPRHTHVSSVPFLRRLNRFRSAVQQGLQWFIQHVYVPSLDLATTWRYAAMTGAFAACLLLLGAIAGGAVKFQLFGEVDGSILNATVEMPSGTPLPVTREAVEHMEESIRRVSERTITSSGEPLVKHILAFSGGALDGSEKIGPHMGSVQAVLLDSDERGVHSEQISRAWEEEIGAITGAQGLTFINIEGGRLAQPFEIWLRGRDLDELLAASEDLMHRLRRTEGLQQVERDFRLGRKEIRFQLKPEARALGLTVADLAQQLKARYFGDEALRIQRGQDDVRVKVRYTSEERGRLSTLDAVRIRTHQGHEVPLFTVAEATVAPGYNAIRRIDGMRTVRVTATIDRSLANARDVLRDLKESAFPKLEEAYPALRISVRGEEKEFQDSLRSLKVGFPLAIVCIFVLIASIFRSYIQPVIILFSVPLGVFGALIGHILMGLDVTMLSLFGMVALAGVAVNDAIVMIEAVNANLASGMPFEEAVRSGGVRRFRAVLLTTLTTVGGLAPLMLETDFQAKFLIPMAVSIAAGELFGTTLTVILVPVLLYVLNDIRRVVVRLIRGHWPTREEVEPARERGERVPLHGTHDGSFPSNPRERPPHSESRGDVIV